MHSFVLLLSACRWFYVSSLVSWLGANGGSQDDRVVGHLLLVVGLLFGL